MDPGPYLISTLPCLPPAMLYLDSGAQTSHNACRYQVQGGKHTRISEWFCIIDFCFTVFVCIYGICL